MKIKPNILIGTTIFCSFFTDVMPVNSATFVFNNESVLGNDQSIYEFTLTLDDGDQIRFFDQLRLSGFPDLSIDSADTPNPSQGSWAINQNANRNQIIWFLNQSTINSPFSAEFFVNATSGITADLTLTSDLGGFQPIEVSLGENQSVPESDNVLSLLALGILGGMSILKQKVN